MHYCWDMAMTTEQAREEAMKIRGRSIRISKELRRVGRILEGAYMASDDGALAAGHFSGLAEDIGEGLRDEDMDPDAAWVASLERDVVTDAPERLRKLAARLIASADRIEAI